MILLKAPKVQLSKVNSYRNNNQNNYDLKKQESFSNSNPIHLQGKLNSIKKR